MKKLLSVGLLLCLFYSAYSQKFIDGPANIRDNPDGEVILSIDDAVNVEVWDYRGDWLKIVVFGYIKESSVINNILLKDAEIFNKSLRKIGTIIRDLNISEHYEISDIKGYLHLTISGYTYKTNIKDLTINEILSKKDVVFNDSIESGIIIYDDNGTKYLYKNQTSYELTSRWLKGDFVDILIKETQTTKYALGSEGSDTKINLTFYPNLSKTDLFEYSKSADRFGLQNNYLISEKYGCCGAEDFLRLSSFPGNIDFLEFNTSFYHIEIPNSNLEFFFGFNVEPRFADTTELVLGELNYSVNQVNTGKISFKAKTKEVQNKIVPFTPDIELISLSANDKINKFTDYSELSAWSLNGIKDISKINGIGIKITFTDDETGKIKESRIMFENGKIKQNEILIEF